MPRLVFFGRVLLTAAALLLASAAIAQEALPALPPPVTRSLYRSHWFDFLNAHLEDDPRAAAAALAEMNKAGRAVGVHRLSDFSRTAEHEARLAEAQARADRAERAYAAALELDDANYGGILSSMRFLAGRRGFGEALRLLPRAVSALLATHESRLALFSSLAVWGALALGLAVLGSVVILFARRLSPMGHDVAETARRIAGPGASVPLALLLLGLPLAFGLGPLWTLLYWAALAYSYAERSERVLLIVGLVLVGLLTPFLELVSRENIIERSPLYMAAVDLEERREDASAEDGLRQASSVFAEDPDVWFLLGMYAERAGDSERAREYYDRSIGAGRKDYRPFLHRGNVYFEEGDFAQAIRDYEAALLRAPNAPEVHYNLSVARGEAYDFEGQSAAMARARELSERDVSFWAEHPTLARVVSAPYGLGRARRKIEEWNAQAKSRRLPGHAPPFSPLRLLLSPSTLGPWAALALALALAAWRRNTASECVRCGRSFCRRCRRSAYPAGYCAECVRLQSRKETVSIEAQVAQAAELQRRTRQKDFACRLTSVLLPGTHRFFLQKPVSGFLLLFSFFFFLAAARIGLDLFDPRQLPPDRASSSGPAAAVGAAAAIWLVSLVSAWRRSHGS